MSDPPEQDPIELLGQLMDCRLANRDLRDRIDDLEFAIVEYLDLRDADVITERHRKPEQYWAAYRAADHALQRAVHNRRPYEGAEEDG